MLFKHPEILFGLLLLIIPIIVHLFQLQRFIKVPFTNVKFLRQIEHQTRKSARIKKWLVLASRLIALASIIIAFAQPYTSKFKETQKFHTVIYLDNSYSMQAKGDQGELMKHNVHQLIDKLQNIGTDVTLITNDKLYENLNQNELKNELIKLDYSPNLTDLNTTLLQVQGTISDKTNTLHNTILISDFQDINFYNKPAFTNVNTPISLLKTPPTSKANIYIDSVFMAEESSANITLKIVVKSVENITENFPISIYQEDQLIGKSTANFESNNEAVLDFNIPNAVGIKGRISLNDESLAFDNNFYFSIPGTQRIQVLIIGEDSEFLRKIYPESEFDLNSVMPNSINYSSISENQLVILNELPEMNDGLISSLNTFLSNGGHIVCIPSEKVNAESYKIMFQELNLGQFKGKISGEHKITKINFDHPIYAGVFEKEVQNFQYPTCQYYYQTTNPRASNILALDTGEPFISSNSVDEGQFYWIASPLNAASSSFTKFSLVVPIFYNIALSSLRRPELYYTIGSDLVADINTKLVKDDVLQVSGRNGTFIPLQQISQNKVTLNFRDQIVAEGHYSILKNNEEMQVVSFNYDRIESQLTYADLEKLSGENDFLTSTDSINTAFDLIADKQQIHWLFKWFLFISALFLLIEMLILKYFKI